jgi:hypothetical protein
LRCEVVPERSALAGYGRFGCRCASCRRAHAENTKAWRDLYRGSVKILSAWPVKANLVLQKRWKFQGRKYTLTAGGYRWYVWPGFGARAAANYGEMLGFSSFTIVH